MRGRKTRRLNRVCAVCQDINTLLVIMVDYKKCIWSGPIHLALIGGDANIITDSVKIGFREITIQTMHTFCTHSIKIVIESSHIFVQMCAQMRFCVCVATPLNSMLLVWRSVFTDPATYAAGLSQLMQIVGNRKKIFRSSAW